MSFIPDFRARFRQSILNRIEVIETCIEEGVRPAALLLQFHSLAGVAGTVGYPEATTLARQGEEACADGVDDRHIANLPTS